MSVEWQTTDVTALKTDELIKHYLASRRTLKELEEIHGLYTAELKRRITAEGILRTPVGEAWIQLRFTRSYDPYSVLTLLGPDRLCKVARISNELLAALAKMDRRISNKLAKIAFVDTPVSVLHVESPKVT